MILLPLGMITPAEARFLRERAGNGLLENAPWWDARELDGGNGASALQADYLMDTLANATTCFENMYRQPRIKGREHHRNYVLVINELPAALRLAKAFGDDLVVHGNPSCAPVYQDGSTSRGVPPAFDGNPTFAIWGVNKAVGFEGIQFALPFLPVPDYFPGGLSLGVFTPYKGNTTVVKIVLDQNASVVLPSDPLTAGFGSGGAIQESRQIDGKTLTVRAEARVYACPYSGTALCVLSVGGA